MSTAYNEFCNKAQDILPQHTDNETISSVAFHLMQLEKDKENEKKILIMEKENEMNILKIMMETERKDVTREMERKQQQLIAFHAKQISAVVQRLVVLYVCMHHESVRFSVFSPLTPADHRFFSSSVCVFCILTDKSSRAF